MTKEEYIKQFIEVEGNETTIHYHALIDLIKRSYEFENTLREVLKRWKYDADQGDGIHETDYALYAKAMKLVDKDYEQQWYKCTVCGRIGSVGRCCGDETREPINDAPRGAGENEV